MDSQKLGSAAGRVVGAVAAGVAAAKDAAVAQAKVAGSAAGREMLGYPTSADATRTEKAVRAAVRAVDELVGAAGGVLEHVPGGVKALSLLPGCEFRKV